MSTISLRTGAKPESISVSPRGDNVLADDPSSGTDVYLCAARLMLPSWLRTVGAAPWFADHFEQTSAGRRGVTGEYMRQSATLAIALLCEHDPARSDASYLREIVRASLTRWQLSLLSNGRPSRRRHRKHPLHVAILSRVAMLLADTAGHQNRRLLQDLPKHVGWLVRKSTAYAPWLEAALVTSLVDVAVLVGERAFLEIARRRLRKLLDRQNREGWFPESGGAEIDRLFRTLDSLSRVYRQTSWVELEQPLRSMLRFLIHFVQPDGNIAACNGSGDCSLLSPYGVELLASEMPEAAALALIGRNQCASPETVRTWLAAEQSAAAWGVGIAMSASVVGVRLPKNIIFPHETKEKIRFPRAGVTIFSNESYHAVVSGKHGGAMRLVWREDQQVLNEPAVIVVYPHSVRRSGHAFARTKETVTHTSVKSHSYLRRIRTVHARRKSGVQKRLRRLLRWLRRSFHKGTPSRGVKPNHQLKKSALPHDRVVREITFGDDWVRMEDRVLCTLPCESIVCRSPSPHSRHPFEQSSMVDGAHSPPIFVDGGRRVVVVRLYRKGRLIDPMRI